MNYFWRRILIPVLIIIGVTAFENINSYQTFQENNSIDIVEIEQAKIPFKFEGKIIKSEDEKSQVEVPKNWSIQDDLNDVADLQVADSTTENYLIVISEPKIDFDNISIEKHSEITRGFILESLKREKVSQPQNFTINGNRALQYKITGSIDNINVVYFHTTIETNENFHQVLAWTLPSRLKANEPILKAIINSFQEN